MDATISIIHTIFNLGASAILPIVIALLGIFFRMKISEAIKSGLMVGVGFIGLTLVVKLLSSSLEPAVNHYAKLGSGYTILDVGWPAVGAASWVAPFAALAIPLGLAINLLLVRLKLTRTMNVDIWNYMHFLIPGALAYFLFGSFWLGLAITLLMSVVALFVGDLIAKRWQDYFGLEVCRTSPNGSDTYEYQTPVDDNPASYGSISCKRLCYGLFLSGALIHALRSFSGRLLGHF